MNAPLAKRMPKELRRDQLLETARAIVREEGTDVLTLGYLAERAGVSKPIAYEHFGTRSGLLIALYRGIDEKQVKVLLEALDRTPKTLEDVARTMGEAYMRCYRTAGPEWHAISAALKADEEMESFQQELLDSYVDLYCNALQPYCNLPRKELRLRCVGIIGAGEALAHGMLRKRSSAAAAATALGALIVAWLRDSSDARPVAKKKAG